jgi:RNA polymerase sigma-70 factor (ECF subfamily)
MIIGRRIIRRGGLPGLLATSRDAPHAFAAFYDSMAPSVLRYFMRQTRDPHRALDLTAETFAKAFEKRADFRGSNDEQAAAWLWAIARAELARFGRSRNVELAALTRLGLERPDPSDDELLRLDELAAIEEAHQHVGAALAHLPREQRDVIRLRFEENLGYEEIANQLGVSTDVVRARTSRALRSLRANPHAASAASALEI